MKRNRIGVLVSLATLVAVLGAAPAAEAKGRIAHRQHRQQVRIGRGIENGQLTAREAARLERREARLNRRIAHDRRDGGGLTRAERRRIERRQDRLSRDIYRQKHDRQKTRS